MWSLHVLPAPESQGSVPRGTPRPSGKQVWDCSGHRVGCSWAEGRGRACACPRHPQALQDLHIGGSGAGRVSGAPGWAESRAARLILIQGQGATIPMLPSLRAGSPWLHYNESLCSICWEPANRRVLFLGTHSFAACPRCFFKSRILHTDKLNLGLNVSFSGADIMCFNRRHTSPCL